MERVAKRVLLLTRQPRSGRCIVAAGLVMSLFLSACASTREQARPDPAPGEQKAASGRLHGVAFDPPLPAADLTLIDPQGAPFRLSEQRGKAVLLTFGYTTCPDVCPTTLADLRRVRDLLGKEGERVQTVFVTVDPERDPPERLGRFVRSVGDETFIGLTGSRQELERVWKEYSIYVEREEAPGSAVGYWVTHTAATYLIAPDGRLLTLYGFGTAPEDIAADLRQILSKEAVQR